VIGALTGLAASSPTTTVLISTCGALLGVIVGGLINSQVQRRNEDRRAATLAHAGGRLVARDLEGAAAVLRATEEDQWVWREGREIEPASWTDYREALAVELGPEAWEAVADAVSALAALAPRLEGSLRGGSSSGPLPDPLRDEIRRVLELLAGADVALRTAPARQPSRRRPTTTT
jgi:hypothetical protein